MSESQPSDVYGVGAASYTETRIEVTRCVQAFIDAYRLAGRFLPMDDCALVATLAFEAQYTMECMTLELMACDAPKVA